MSATTYELSHLRALEAEAIHIIREVAAEFERPGAAVLGRQGLDRHAAPGREGVRARPGCRSRSCTSTPATTSPRSSRSATRWSSELGVRLVVASVQDDIDAGRLVEDTGPRASRNRLQTVTLLRGIEEQRFDAVFGGARRDEEKARAKERVFSFRDEFGQWDPKNQRPELWSLYNGRHRKGEHIRVFPLSNWTELDIWQYIADEGIELPSIYFAHRRTRVPARRHVDGRLRRSIPRLPGEEVEERTVRFRTVGDVTCTGAVESPAATLDAGHRRGGRHPAHRAGRHPGRRPHQRGRHGRPQEGGVLLMAETAAGCATAGSVDDGKSTLIGRLLYDSKAIFEDQLEAVERTSRERGDEYTNLALLTDGLRAEREQGITIDVAYRYFATPKRKFIIADTPGHIQYTRNMVTGASTADLALDPDRRPQGRRSSSRGATPSWRRCSASRTSSCASTRWTSSTGARSASRRSRPSSAAFAMKLDVHDLTFIPVSALHGDNVVDRSAQHALVRGRRRCCTTSRRCTSRRTATSSTRGSRCST